MLIDTIVYEKNSGTTRIAALSKSRLCELEVIDENKASEGSIYLGKIIKKIELANGKIGFFIEIGDSGQAFINAEEAGINDLEASEGQSVIVQVAQEKRAEKGARVVRSLQFVGANLVYCPYRMDVEASSKIENKHRLAEIKEGVLENTTGQEGWILRTACVDAEPEVIAAEMEELRCLFDNVVANAKKSSAPQLLLSKANPLFEYIKRLKTSLQKIVVNSHNIEEELKVCCGEWLEIECQSNPFEKNGLEEEILEALSESVRLKNGGRLHIEETKAVVAIDVDSGDDKGFGSVARLNNEAAVEIVRQIILRNLSGKIVIDFAGVCEYKYLKPILDVLEKELKADYTKSSVLGLSRAGNVEIVRVRRRPSLRDLFTKECESCQGSGRVEL